MVALADVSDGGPNNEKINILTKYTEAKEGNDWGKEAVENSKSDKWNVQLAVKELQKTRKEVVIKSLAVAAKENKIFLIMVSSDTCEKCNPSEALSTKAEWYVTLVEGKVKGDADSDQKKTMVWSNLNFYVSYENSKLEELLSKQLSILPVEGFVFVADNKKYIIFVIKNNAGNNNYITAVFQLEEKEGEEPKLLPVDGTAGCYPTFFKWKGEIFKTPTDEPKDCKEKMMVFNTKGNNFTECTGSIARLRDFLKDKKHFTTAKINENNKLLLFTQQKDAGGAGKNVYLWMSDGTRVGFVGTIVENIKDTFYGSVLYTKKELFVLHQKYDTQPAGAKDDNKFTFKRLEKHLQNITDTLKAWKKNEKIVLALCQNNNEENRLCIASPPRAALVSFLHNTTSEDADIIIWKDEYYFSNATIKKGKAEKITNGFKFSGKESEAKWLVSNPNKDHPYNFTDPGFTLISTVKIDNNGKQLDNSLFGVTLSGETKRVGLLCTRQGKWGVTYAKTGRNEIISSETDCKQEVTYNVALMLGDEKVSVYVDGKKLNWEEENKEIGIKYTDTITYFYFGADNDVGTSLTTESHVTVTNVLLYNRPFFLEEIKNLKEYKKPPETTNNFDESFSVKDDEQQPPSRAEDGGVGGGVRVFSLLLAVLCASAPLLHL